MLAFVMDTQLDGGRHLHGPLGNTTDHLLGVLGHVVLHLGEATEYVLVPAALLLVDEVQLRIERDLLRGHVVRVVFVDRCSTRVEGDGV